MLRRQMRHLRPHVWENEASSYFEKFLTHMSETFKKLEDTWQPLYSQQVQNLLRGVDGRCTSLNNPRDYSWSVPQQFDWACLTLSHTIPTRFINVEQIRNKRSIGAVPLTRGCLGGWGWERKRQQHSGWSGGNAGGRMMRVTMNGVGDVTADISRNLTTEEWDTFQLVGDHS